MEKNVTFQYVYTAPQNQEIQAIRRKYTDIWDKPKLKASNKMIKEIRDMRNFLKKAFEDMKASAKAQHEVDKAQFEAVKAEGKAQWEEAKMTPSGRQAKMQEERQEQIKAANERSAAAQIRIDAAKKRQ